MLGTPSLVHRRVCNLQCLSRSLEQTEKAVQSARSARRKRWICFGITVFVIAVLALVLGLYFGLRAGGGGGGGNSNNN